MKKSILIICFVLYSFNIISSASGYCSLCAGHIACNTTGDFNPNCPRDAIVVPLSSVERNILLDAHNNYRNQIASGSIPNFPTAERMMAVTWDFELAWLAELNVMQCVMEHDQCRSTSQFPFAGQNIYMHGTTGDWNPIAQQLNGAAKLWFEEYRLSNSSDISNCCGGSRFPQIGHFLQMVQDRVIRIGCASARYSTIQWATTLVTCNYSWGNFNNQPVYRSGDPGSRCTTRHGTFTNLCNT
ncbi:unnamed protein product [Chironomus riparius]|uniref:SCP domain-containing protein n=1 Tax=Chironomus riparius TaxID=315576 RepID=A0A9N9RYY6_9DIPT|nr:unnamed protein product [Chironomus riparius]